MYVDTHCHLEIEDFDDDRDEIIKASLVEGLVCMLTVGTEERYFAKVTEIIDKYPEVYGAIGIHPHNAGDFNDHARERLISSLKHPKMLALGEIGLDFFKNRSPQGAQIKAFEGQIELAKLVGLPVIVHSRNAARETVATLRDLIGGLSAGGVIHCFSYDVETARKLLDMGFYLSIPGTITYNKNTTLVDVARYIPQDRILAETDAPFLAPHPYRGKRNVPHFVKITVERLAKIRNIGIDEMALHIRRNFETLFLRDQKGV